VLKCLYMALERSVLDSLQHLRSGRPALTMSRHAVSAVLLEFTRAAQGRAGADALPIERVTVHDVRHLLSRNRAA
jgi:hypothetical protein